MVRIAPFAFREALPTAIAFGLFVGLLTRAVFDDPYIHLAIARNLSEHAVFGIHADRADAASSSPLWVAVLAGLHRIGMEDPRIPLVLNLFGAGLLLVIADRIARRFDVPWALRLVMGCVLILHVPLVPVAATGMEHLVHASASLAFVGLAIVALHRGPRGRSVRTMLGLGVLAATATGLRYESLFAVGIVSGAAFVRRDPRLAFVVLGAGMAPVVVFGVAFWVQGAHFLPNPVLLKPDRPSFQSGAELLAHLLRGPERLADQRHLGRLFEIVLFLAIVDRWRRGWSQRSTWASVTIAMVLAHATFARFGWFYRYEAYLMAQTLVVAMLLGVALVRGTDRWRRAVAIVVVLASLAYAADGAVARDQRALARTPVAMNEIFAQQRQMARFLDQNFRGEAVAVNDIGAVAYEGNVDVVDLFGLASREVLDHKLRGTFDREALESIVSARGARVAIVYRRWFASIGLPESWIELARWEIPTRETVSDRTVSVFAIGSEAVEDVVAALERFEPTLPGSVTIGGRDFRKE